ncbi:MAG: TIGR02757 family protein [bacterium]
MKKNNNLLKQKLEYHYKAFDRSKISPDPLEFLHRYNDACDIEISGILSSVFAYGNIKQIILILEKVHKLMGKSPYNFIINFNVDKQKNKFANLYHRFYSSNDIISLFLALQEILLTYGSLKYLFLLYYFETDKNLKNAIYFFNRNITLVINKYSEPTTGTKFMFPDPAKGSACKRLNLFLRWMVRKDELDFGIWEEISPSKLTIPLDTHIAKISTELKLTTQKIANWKMAEEITQNLKQFDEDDPIKYDFALCHIGMRNQEF